MRAKRPVGLSRPLGRSVLRSPFRPPFDAPTGGASLRDQVIASLFSSGQPGALFDYTDLSALRVGRDGTGTATDGAVCGTALDLSGNGHTMSCSADSERPLIEVIGGVRYITMDGVDDCLFTANGSLPFSGQLCLGVVTRVPDGAFPGIASNESGMSLTSGGLDYQSLGVVRTTATFAHQTRNLAAGYEFTSSAFSGTGSDEPFAQLAVWDSAGTISAFLDGSPVSGGAHNIIGPTSTLGGLSLGRRSLTFPALAPIHYAAAVACYAPTPEQVAIINSWLLEVAGK